MVNYKFKFMLSKSLGYERKYTDFKFYNTTIILKLYVAILSNSVLVDIF